MAAILCRSIGQAFHAVGSTLSYVLCLPCRACGMGCELANEICTSAFFPYLALTFLLNLPPIVKTASILDDYMEGTAWCARGSHWLMMNSVLCALHMVASMYIVHKIRHEPPKKKSNNTDGTSETPAMAAAVTGKEEVDKNNGKIEAGTYYAVASPAEEASVSSEDDEDVTQPLSMARIKDVLCEDPGMAIYLLVIFFWIIWLSVGVSRARQLGEECGDIKNVIEISLLCGWLYFALVGLAFGISLCCL